MKKLFVLLFVVILLFVSNVTVFAQDLIPSDKADTAIYPYAVNDLFDSLYFKGDSIHLFANQDIIVSGKFNGNANEEIMVIKKYVSYHVNFDADGGMIWASGNTLEYVQKQFIYEGKNLKTVFITESDFDDHCIASNFLATNYKLHTEEYVEPLSIVKLPKGTIIRSGAIFIGKDSFIATDNKSGANCNQPVEVIQLTADTVVELPLGGFISKPGTSLFDLLNDIQKIGWERNYINITVY